MTEPTSGGRLARRLARFSFDDGVGAAALLSREPLLWWDAVTNAPVDENAAAVIAALGRTADPDAALRALAGIIAGPEGPRLRTALGDSMELRARLLSLLGVSTTLAEHLVAQPADWRGLVGHYDPSGISARLAAAVDADAAHPVTGTAGTRARRTGLDAVSALRNAYRRELVAIAGRDLAGELDLASAALLFKSGREDA